MNLRQSQTEQGKAGLLLEYPLILIKREGPEILRRHVWWQVNLVGLAAIKCIAVLVEIGDQVLGADTDILDRHRRLRGQTLMQSRNSTARRHRPTGSAL